MKIVAYQIKDDLCRFIYKTQHGYKVVSAVNYNGLMDFLRQYGGKQLDASINPYEYVDVLKKIEPIVEKM